MSHPSMSETATRGRQRLEHALTHSLLMPREVAAFQAVLAALDTAHRALRGPAADITDPVAHAAGILMALIDGYLSALTELGTDR